MGKKNKGKKKNGGGGGREPDHNKGANDDWLSEFADLFNSCVNSFDSAEEALEELGSSEKAQPLFEKAAAQFQEEAVSCLVNCGRVHLSLAAQHRTNFQEAIEEGIDVKETLIDSEWSNRLNMAKEKFDQALEIEPESYDVFFALGEHQYEMVFLNCSMRIDDSAENQLALYNTADAHMKSAFRIWKTKGGIQADLNISTSNKKEQVSKIKKRPGIQSRQKKELNDDACGILGLWAEILYCKSEVEFDEYKDWRSTLDMAIKKYELLGFSKTEISERLKNHVSEEDPSEGVTTP